MSFQPNRVLPNSTSMRPLGAGEEFIAPWTDVENWASVSMALETDVSGQLFAEFSADGVNAASPVSYTVVGGTVEPPHALGVSRPFFRVRYVNGSDPQTYFRLVTMASQDKSISTPLNLSVGQDADATVVRSVPAELEIGQGRIGGYSVVNKLGKNSDIDTGTVPEWVTEQGGVYAGFNPTVANTLSVVSSSADDSAAGAGVQQVRIIGLDADYNSLVETVTLNGTTAVQTTGEFIRCHTFFAVRAGSADAYNAGEITVTHDTNDDIMLTMIAGISGSNYAVYTIPAGKTGYLTFENASIRRGTASAADGAYFIRTFNGPSRLRRPFTIGNNNPLRLPIYGGLRLPEKTDIGMVITAVTTNNTSITGGYTIILVDN